jgi:hypothetical protein
MSDNDESASWTDTDTFPVPSKVFECPALLIDKEIRGRIDAKREPRVRENRRVRAIAIGRRSLEVAIVRFHDAQKLNPTKSDWEPEWASIRDSAVDAEKSLKKALRAISPKGRFARDYRKQIGKIRIQNAKFDGGDSWKREQRARRDALILLAARGILRELGTDAERRRGVFANDFPEHADFGKRAFVKTLYEGWICLMGVRPGSTTIVEQNPFLQFVEAAWQDWKGEDAAWVDAAGTKRVSFVQALKLARLDILDGEVARIVEVGPDWAR